MRSGFQGREIVIEPIALLALVAGLLLLSSGRVFAESIDISVHLSDSVVAASDSVTLTCIVRWDDELIALSSESPPNPELKRLEIGAVSVRFGSITYQGKVYSQRIFSYTLRPLRSGLGLISSLQIGYVTLPDSTPALASSRPLTVRIVIPRRAGDSHSRGLWPWAALALIVGAGAGGIWLWRARRKKSARVNPQVERIEGRLRKLKALTSASRADFYTEAHGLLMQIQFREKAQALAPELEAKLAGWITVAAREKFAPGRGEPGEALRHYVEIESFVRAEILEKRYGVD